MARPIVYSRHILWVSLIFISHLLLTLVLMFSSFAIVMTRVGERETGTESSASDHWADDLVHTSADLLLFPLAYSNPARGEHSFLVDLLPGPWSWLAVGLNSFFWALLVWFAFLVGRRWAARRDRASVEGG